MVGERYAVNKVCGAITKAFGGEQETSAAMLNVALGKQTKYSLVKLVKSKALCTCKKKRQLKR